MRKRADSLAFVPKDGIKCKETVFRAGDNCPNTASFFLFCKQCLKTFHRTQTILADDYYDTAQN